MFGAFNGSAISAAAPFATGDGRDREAATAGQFNSGRRASVKGRESAGWNGGSWGNDAREEAATPSGRSASRSSLMNAGSTIGNSGTGYNSSRSQITFGNGNIDPPRNSGYTRFAGKTNQSSLSFANFGGSGEDTRFNAAQPLRTDASLAQRQHPQQQFQEYSQPNYQMPQDPAERIQATPQHGKSYETEQQPGLSLPTGANNNLSPLMDKLISEIAELRVKNQDLESYIDHLERKLAMYEGVPQ